MVKNWYMRPVVITEFDETGNLYNIFTEKPEYSLDQCPTTTKIKTARCWKRWRICGFHAARKYPALYVKAKGSSTGGRHGKSEEIHNPLIIPALLA